MRPPRPGTSVTGAQLAAANAGFQSLGLPVRDGPGVALRERQPLRHGGGRRRGERHGLSHPRSTLIRMPASDSKYDVKRALKQFYAPTNTDWALVDVPPQRFIAVDGRGDPNTSADYTHAVEALYAVAYTIKFGSKRTLGRDFVVGPLEGLWWSDRPEVFVTREKAAWQWRMLVSLPDWITDESVAEASRTVLAKKGPAALPALPGLRPETLHEGTSAQLLHVGPYDDEGPALARLHGEYLAANGLRMTGHHHEVYLSDPRRVRPERLRTVLRQPVAPAG